VWWEEANPWGHDTFEIERAAHTGGIPDLIVEANGWVVVVEFKTGSSVGQIYDSLTQLLGYWTEHLTADQTFVAGSEALSVDGFVTASKHSRYGRLFPPYAEIAQTLAEMDDGRASCARYGQLPPTEYRMTEQHSRTMWRLGDERAEALSGVGETPHLGVLLSDHLETEQLDPAPALLWNRGDSNQDWEVLD